MTYEMIFGDSKPRATLRNGDVLKGRIGNGLCVIGTILERDVMYGFASLLNIYQAKFPDDISIKGMPTQLSSIPSLMGPVLVDSDIVRSGLMVKIGKCALVNDELEAMRFLSPIADGDHPLAAKYDPSIGSFVLGDRAREPDFVVNWKGVKAAASSEDKLGLWGTVPNADSLAERLESTLNNSQ